MSLSFAVLGDSIAYGMGAAAPADTIGARLARDLAAHGTPAEPRVFAVSGADSRGLAAQVQRATVWEPAVALIIIGANDLTHFVPSTQAASLLGEAVTTLRANGAQVVVAPAPDLSVVPWCPPAMRLTVKAASDLLRRQQTEAAVAAGAHVADLGGASADAFATDPSLFSADRFHPSSAGYAVIAAAIAPTMRTAVAAAA